MAKRTIKGKNIEDYLQAEGFKELKVSEKKKQWYKKASEITPCSKEGKEKVNK